MTDKSPTERKMLPTERFELFYQELIRDEVTKAFQEYPDKKSLLLDYNELDLFDQHLGDLLDEKPAEALKAATKELHKLNPFPPKKVSLTVRITNTKPSVRSLRFLKSARLHKLVTVDALVKKTTPIIPVIKNAMFECRSCMRIFAVFGIFIIRRVARFFGYHFFTSNNKSAQFRRNYTYLDFI
jgi:replicative DNA helicase Mcm